jgi:DNA-binding transcriptional MerR regulator
MRIGEVAKRSGVSVKAIRYYEEIEVLAEPRRLASGYRDYDGDTVERLRFIRASQASGLSLGEIKGIVAYRDRGESPCSHVLDLLRRRSDEIDAQIEELRRSRSIIKSLVTRSRKLRPEDCSASSVCHLIIKSNSRS